MNSIAITVTGRLGDDPRTFTTKDGTDGVELRLALDLPSRSPGRDGITRWVKVTAFGLLAARTGTGSPSSLTYWNDSKLSCRQPRQCVRSWSGRPAWPRSRQCGQT